MSGAILKFIEIQNGLSIRIDEIESISSIDEFTSEIKIGSTSYVANFPYSVLLKIIEEPEQEVKQYEQHFAG